MGHCSVLERLELPSHEKTRRNLEWVLLSEKPILQATHYTTFSKRCNYGDREKIGAS